VLLHQEVDRSSYTHQREDEEQNDSEHLGRAGLQAGVKSTYVCGLVMVVSDDHHQPWKVCQRSERGAEAPLYLI
jgi:hypothetical protein